MTSGLRITWNNYELGGRKRALHWGDLLVGGSPSRGPTGDQRSSHTVTQNSALSLFLWLVWLRYSVYELWFKVWTLHTWFRQCAYWNQALQKHVREIGGGGGVRKKKGKEKKCTISNSVRVCLLSALVSMRPSRCYAKQAVSSQNPWPISCEIDLCQKQSVSPHTVRRTHRPDSRCLFSAENKINCWRMKSIISRWLICGRRDWHVSPGKDL